MMKEDARRTATFRIADPDCTIRQRRQYIDGLLVQTRYVQCESFLE